MERSWNVKFLWIWWHFRIIWGYDASRIFRCEDLGLKMNVLLQHLASPTLLPPNAGVSDANSNFSFRTHRPFPLQVPFQFMHQQNCWTFLWALARCSLVSKFPAKCEVAEKVVRACSDARPHLVMTDLGPTWSSLPRSDSLTSSYNAPHPSASHQNVTIVPSLFPHNFSTRWVGQQNLKRCQKSQMTLFHDLFLQNHLATGVQHHFHL